MCVIRRCMRSPVVISLLMHQSLQLPPTLQFLLHNVPFRHETCSKPSCSSMRKTSIFRFTLVYFQNGLRKTTLLFILTLENVFLWMCAYLCAHVHVCRHTCVSLHVEDKGLPQASFLRHCLLGFLRHFSLAQKLPSRLGWMLVSTRDPVSTHQV